MTTKLPPRDRIIYRPAADNDVPFLRALYGSTREEEMRMVPWSDEDKARFLDLQFHAQKSHYDEFYPNCEYLVIELEGTPVGRLYIDRGELDIEIVDIALVPEQRGRGIGGVLVGEILAEAEASGRKVTIYVEHFNPARHLYDRLGFAHVDTNGVYHLMQWSPGQP